MSSIHQSIDQSINRPISITQVVTSHYASLKKNESHAGADKHQQSTRSRIV